jgi:hypothetical protein
MNLQETIKRILREETKQLRDLLVPVNPKGVLHHRTTYKHRESIQKHGLLPKVGQYTENYMSHHFPDSEPLPMLFASDPEYSFFGNDVWEIDLNKANVKWFHDPIHKDDGNNFKYYVTLDPIPLSAIKLINSNEESDDDLETYKETGKYPNRNPQPEEPKVPEEPNKWGDMLKQLGDDEGTISMDDLLNLKESIRKVLREEISKKFQRPNENTSQLIVKYLNLYFKKSIEQDTPKSRAYGSLNHRLCVDGLEIISGYFYFDDEEFNRGSLLINKEFVKSLMKIFSVRQAYVVSVIEDWYEDYKLPSFEERMGESNLHLTELSGYYERNSECHPEPELPEGITDEEMIDYIVNHTLYTKENVLQRVESGDEDLKDFYLQIVDIQNRDNR